MRGCRHDTTYPPLDAHFDFGGIIGRRLQACLEQWWLVAPDANPAMLQMFRDRDRLPPRDLLPWSGEFAGKYLTSAVGGWRLTGDARLRQMIGRIVDELAAAQDPSGYLGPFPHATRLFGPGRTPGSGQEFVLWDLWGHYHLMLGLMAWYAALGYRPALEICTRIADLLCATFLEGGARTGDTGAGAEEMNLAVSHGLCLLYRQTGEPRYLALVRAIEQDWQRPPAGDYVRQALAGRAFYQMPKPRWESLHDVQGHRRAVCHHRRRAVSPGVRGDLAEHPAGDRHNTGGFSSGEQATGNPYDPRPIETCCTIAWMALFGRHVAHDRESHRGRRARADHFQRHAGRPIAHGPLVDLQHAHGRRAEGLGPRYRVPGAARQPGAELLLGQRPAGWACWRNGP